MPTNILLHGNGGILRHTCPLMGLCKLVYQSKVQKYTLLHLGPLRYPGPFKDVKGVE